MPSTVALAKKLAPYSDLLSSVTKFLGTDFSGTTDQAKLLVKVDPKSAHEEVELLHFLAALAEVDFEGLRDADQKVDPEKLKDDFEKIDLDLTRIATDPRVLELRDAYCTSAKDAFVNKERAHYKPFARLANKVLELLRETKDNSIAFRRNDIHSRGGASKNKVRTPDIVIVDGKHESVKDGKQVDMNSGTFQDIRYNWADILSAIEFKLKDGQTPGGEQPADAEPVTDPQTSRPSDNSTSIDGSIISGLNTSISHLDSVDKVPVGQSSGSGLPSAAGDVITQLPVKAGHSNRAHMPNRKMSGVQRPVAGSKLRGKGGTGKMKRHMASGTVSGYEHLHVKPQSRSSAGSKKNLPVEIKTKGSRDTRPQNNGNSGRDPDLCEQSLRYAIEQHSYSQDLRHIYNALVADGKMRACYYDRTGIVRTSQPLDFVNDLLGFAFLLKRMKDTSEGEHSILEQMTEDVDGIGDAAEVGSSAPTAKSSTGLDVAQEDVAPKSVDPILRFSLRMKGQTFRFIRRLAYQRPQGLVGRATDVIEAKLISIEGDAAVTRKIGIGSIVAVKMSWALKSRISEVDIIAEGRKKLRELDEDAKFRRENNTEGKLEDCLPVIYDSEDEDDLEAKGSFRQRLNILTGVESRVRRMIVFELLRPIYMLDNLWEFKKCFRGIFQGLHFLWISGIMHRDISIENLMYRCVGSNVCGVLNGWDQESRLNGSKTQTPSPFMARDFLTDKPEEYYERFDWESLLYALIWTVCHCGVDDYVVRDDTLGEWLKHDINDLRAYKVSACVGEIPVYLEQYKGLRSWIVPMQDLFVSGYKSQYGQQKYGVKNQRLITHEEKSAALVPKPYDRETLKGHVTYNKLLNIYRS
ncbi:hypothetical protein M0805_004370 [Coniferiporia weirii]|nr:hypothetical protein M0805_004370 [Coniferiporia weirii]